MAEVLGLISSALQAIAAVDRAVVLFDRLQNAPKQMRLVRILLGQIDHDLNALRESDNNSTGIVGHDQEGAGGNSNRHPWNQQIPAATVEEINNALAECRSFLDRYSERFSSKGTMRRIFWSALKAAELESIRGRIAEIYPLIITPLTMRLLLARMPAPVHRGQDAPLVLELEAAQAGAVLDMAPPSYRRAVAVEAGGIPVSISEGAARPYEARETAQELEAVLTVKLRDILETDAITEVDADLRNLRGATLILQGDDVPPEYRTLVLDELQVAARDEETTMLRFSCSGGTIRVKHLVPFSTPPCLSAVGSPDVYFRATHPITLLRADGHLLLHVAQPRYHFADAATRRKFQELVRARTLVDEVEGVEVLALFRDGDGRGMTGGTETTSVSWSSSSSSGGSSSWKSRVKKRRSQVVCLAQSEPLQIWRREGVDRAGGPRGAVTVTFLADTERLSGGGGGGGGGTQRDQWRVLEWHAEDLASGAEVVAGKRSAAPKEVEMWWAIHCVGAAPGVRITFRSNSEATRFAERFKPPDQESAILVGVVGSAQVQSRPSLLAPIKRQNSIGVGWLSRF
ncbi:hypothetical protein B0H67DRAFT_679596 [Lasiosphaeris hirsuta]|uniref:Uncharacterized protein n=1 Tax=Lasiosphaeris hirsuta TaxID=260670 RepID=A0AA40BDC6_9PEZI|nr:hypothetical protein B0H67DRAFT_679596 [Lasiosphaeris hirsuta]